MRDASIVNYLLFRPQGKQIVDSILVIGSLFNGRGDIVDEIIKSFRKTFYVDWVDPGIYLSDRFVNRRKWRRVNLTREVLFDLNNYKYVFFISGGYMPSDNFLLECKRNNVKVISWQLSDPDDYELRGKFLSKKCDLIVTNSEQSHQLYSESNKSLLLDFACNPFEVDIAEKEEPILSDYIVVGECRPDRLEKLLMLENLQGALYGRGWSSKSEIEQLNIVNEIASVSGQDKYKAIKKSRLYISFGQTLAGGNNLKVGFFEALSLGALIATDSELKFFQKTYGNIPYVFEFKTASELKSICEEIHRLPLSAIQEMRTMNMKYFMNNHTWQRRIMEIINAA